MMMMMMRSDEMINLKPVLHVNMSTEYCGDFKK